MAPLVLDAVLVLILLVGFIAGWRRGFLSALVGAAALAASALLANWGSLQLAEPAYERFVRPRLVALVQQKLAGGASSAGGLFGRLLAGVTLRTGTAADAAEAVVDAAIAPTAQTAVRYVLFLLFFLLLLLVFGLLTKALRAANKAPLLGTANRLFGGVLGLACGVLAAFLYVSLCALVVISTNDTLSWLNTDLISQSRLFSLAYPYNLFELLGAAM